MSSTWAIVGTKRPDDAYHFNWGVIDSTGKPIVGLKYDPIVAASGNTFIVPSAGEGHYALMDVEGHILFETNDTIESYSEGILLVDIGSCPDHCKFVFADVTGKRIVDKVYDNADKFSEGIALADENDHDGAYSFIDKNGEEVLSSKLFSPSPTQDAVFPSHFSEGMAPVVQTIFAKDKYGFSNPLSYHFGCIDRQGKVAIPFEYLSDEEFSQGYVALQAQDRKWGYMDKEGRWLIKPVFYSAGPFMNGLAAVRKDKQHQLSYINTRGNVVWEGEAIAGN